MAALDAVLRRDRAIVAAALAALTALAWAYTLWLVDAMSMGGMDMPGMRMDANPFGAAMRPAVEPWTSAEFALAFLMWSVMMVGMMTPSAAPMILLYARVGRQAEKVGRPLAATGFFAGGYLLAWTGFSLFATIAQWGLERALLLTPMMASNSAVFGAAVLVATGLFQWTPWKDSCLAYCQSPVMFLSRHGGFRRAPSGALALGFRHGLYCVGCCWLLMAILFVAGVMNVAWIAGIAIFVLAEKLLPWPRAVSRLTGGALVIAGAWQLAQAFA